MADQLAKRPRIEGEREREIYTAATELLAEVGYDQLTIDAVAARAKVSKASIYRRWGDKAALVDAAIECQEVDDLTLPDTGSPVDDVVALVATPGFFDPDRAAIVSALATAVHRDPERHDGARRRLVDDGTKHVRELLRRAVRRGDLVADADVELLSSVIPAMVLFRMTYQTVGTFSADYLHGVVEDVLSPAIRHQSNNEKKEHRGSPTRR